MGRAHCGATPTRLTLFSRNFPPWSGLQFVRNSNRICFRDPFTGGLVIRFGNEYFFGFWLYESEGALHLKEAKAMSQTIAIDQLQPNPWNRKSFDPAALQELT